MRRSMEFFEEIRRQSRIILSRDFVLEDSVIDRYRMGLVDNSIFSEDVDEGVIDSFIMDCIELARRRGCVCVVDRSKRYVKGTVGSVHVVSVMYFGDVYSWCLFLLWRWEWYWDMKDRGDRFGMLLN